MYGKRGMIVSCSLIIILTIMISCGGSEDVPVSEKNQDETRMTDRSTSPPASPVKKTWEPPEFTQRIDDRRSMVRVIKSYGLNDEDVLEAMQSVPRHEFVPDRLSDEAYNDSPLPIGYGQTISQPYIVAEMTRLLDLHYGDKVLEIGTGSGYQAAVLTEFTPDVFTMEIIEPLYKKASKKFKSIGYNCIKTKHGDGYNGWPEHAPYDAIVVTAAAGEIPPPLIKQLKRGGRMIIPVGSRFGSQSLMLVEKDEHGKIKTRNLMAVRFVPLVRKDRTK